MHSRDVFSQGLHTYKQLSKQHSAEKATRYVYGRTVQNKVKDKEQNPKTRRGGLSMYGCSRFSAVSEARREKNRRDRSGTSIPSKVLVSSRSKQVGGDWGSDNVG